MKKMMALLALVISTYSFAYSEATNALLSLLNGNYHGYDCAVRVAPVDNGVKVELFKNNESMEYLVKEGSPFQYRAYGRFVSSYRERLSSVNYNESTFFTTPTNFGRYALIETREVRNRASKVTKIECEIID